MNKNNPSKQSNYSRLVTIALGLPWVEIITEAWKYGRKLLRGMTSEGMYEVLEYEMALDLHDAKGKSATYRKKEHVRYMQNNIIAYYDQGWGDGKILLNFRSSPGVAVDRYRSGHKTLVLISLRQVRHRGDEDVFRIEWDMKDCFLTSTEEWTTTINYKFKLLRINVTFPPKRPPLKMSMIETNRRQHTALGKDNLRRLPSGRWQVSWEKKNPHLYEDYTFKWEW